jgi:hypothetical protein
MRALTHSLIAVTAGAGYFILYHMNGIDAELATRCGEQWGVLLSYTRPVAPHHLIFASFQTSRRYNASIFDLITRRPRHPLCACKHTGLILYKRRDAIVRPKWSGTREDVATLTADLQPDWALENFTLPVFLGWINASLARTHSWAESSRAIRVQIYSTFYSHSRCRLLVMQTGTCVLKCQISPNGWTNCL